GATSTQREASPASGRNPWATVPKKAAYWGCRLSRNAYDRSSIPLVTISSICSCDYLHAGRGSDSRRSGRDHVLCVMGGAHTAGCLHPHVGPNRLADEGYVVHRRPARPEAGRGLDEVGFRPFGHRGRDHLLLVGEKGGLEDHLADRSHLVRRISNLGDVVVDELL